MSKNKGGYTYRRKLQFWTFRSCWRKNTECQWALKYTRFVFKLLMVVLVYEVYVEIQQNIYFDM